VSRLVRVFGLTITLLVGIMFFATAVTFVPMALQEHYGTGAGLAYVLGLVMAMSFGIAWVVTPK
jgi:hypothetical protein